MTTNSKPDTGDTIHFRPSIGASEVVTGTVVGRKTKRVRGIATRTIFVTTGDGRNFALNPVQIVEAR